MSERIYWMVDQDANVEEFAWAGLKGTWLEPDYCSSCGQYQGTPKTAPYLVYFERGSMKIGDFNLLGGEFLVNDRAKSALELLSDDLVFHEPSYLPSKYKRNVVDAASLPAMYVTECRALVSSDIKLSELVLDTRSCERRLTYDFKFENLVISASELSEKKIFRIREFGYSTMMFCVESVARAIEREKFTNIRFVSAGIVVA
jgi:hypothetical protein